MGSAGAQRPWRWHALAVAGVAAVCLWRCLPGYLDPCLPGYLDPVLFGEDWSILFAGQFWERSAARVFEPYAGYVSFGPQLIGWLAAFLPAGARPHALAFAAGAIAAGALGWFASPRFSHLLPEPRLRAFACVLLALLPLADAPLLCTAMHAHWHLLFVVCLATVAAPPLGHARHVEVALVTACAWSHPLALLTVPVLAWRAARESGPVRRHYATLALGVLAYLSFGIDGQAKAPGPTDGWAGACVTLVRDVILPSFLLHEDLAALAAVARLLVVPLAILLAVAARDARRSGRSLAMLVPAAFAFAIAAATTASRWPDQGHLLWTSPRYAYVPSLLLALCATVAVLGLARRRAGLAVAALAAHALALNTTSSVPDRFRFAPPTAAWSRSPPSWRSGPVVQGRRASAAGSRCTVGSWNSPARTRPPHPRGECARPAPGPSPHLRAQALRGLQVGWVGTRVRMGDLEVGVEGREHALRRRHAPPQADRKRSGA